MKVLIVDDERPARERLKQMLAEHADVEAVIEAANAEDALQLARMQEPDLLLLDIQMPGVDGLSMARDTVGLPPIIFTTAHREYAVDAFEIAALDYLLKPIKRKRLAAALDRARTLDARTLPRINELLDQLRHRPGEMVRITARHGDSYEVLDAREIGRFSASDKYVVCAHAGREIILDQSLRFPGPTFAGDECRIRVEVLSISDDGKRAGNESMRAVEGHGEFLRRRHCIARHCIG